MEMVKNKENRLIMDYKDTFYAFYKKSPLN